MLSTVSGEGEFVSIEVRKTKLPLVLIMGKERFEVKLCVWGGGVVAGQSESVTKYSE